MVGKKVLSFHHRNIVYNQDYKVCMGIVRSNSIVEGQNFRPNYIPCSQQILIRIHIWQYWYFSYLPWTTFQQTFCHIRTRRDYMIQLRLSKWLVLRIRFYLLHRRIFWILRCNLPQIFVLRILCTVWTSDKLGPAHQQEYLYRGLTRDDHRYEDSYSHILLWLFCQSVCHTYGPLLRTDRIVGQTTHDLERLGSEEQRSCRVISSLIWLTMLSTEVLTFWSRKTASNLVN